MTTKQMEAYITSGWYRDNPYLQKKFDDELCRRLVEDWESTKPTLEIPTTSFIKPYEIKKVVFNPPCTIILWTDGTKTIVRAQNDEPFDPEKGMTMAFMKKVRGNKGNYFDEIKKWVEPWEAKQVKVEEAVEEPVDLDALMKLKELANATNESVKNLKTKVDRLKELMNESVKDE